MTLVLLSSCEKRETCQTYENNVFKEVFPEIVDSICTDRRLVVPPPIAQAPFIKANGDTIKYDTIGFQNKLKEYNKELARIKRDTLNLFIAVADSIHRVRKVDEPRIISYFETKKTQADTTDIKPYKFDLNPFKENGKYKFKYASAFPENDFIWDKKYDFNLAGVLIISGIQFDKNKKYGALSAVFMCGYQCGNGYLIFIEKVDGKWKIETIIHRWTS